MRILSIMLSLLLAALSPAAAAAETRTLELGVVPYLPTTNLISAYQPLRSHLEKKLQSPVQLTTAPDFVTFLERCLRREYDVVVLGPGLGRFIQAETGYQPLIVTKRNVKALVLVDRNAPYTRLKDLSGKRVAMLEPMIVLSQLGKEVFLKAGMLPDRDYRIHLVKSPSNAVHAVLQGEVEAGVTTANLVPQLGEDIRHKLKVLAESREIPGLMFMVSPSPALRPEHVRNILLQFEQAAEGRRFIDSLAMDGFRVPAARELKSLDGFLPEFRKHFKP